MTAPACPTPLEWDSLLSYWLGELDPDGEARIEEHYLGCTVCSRRLAQLLVLAQAVRTLASQGGVNVVINEHFLLRLVDNGLQVREYRVPCNGSVNCFIAPDDDIVVAHLAAALDQVQQLDLVTYGPGDGQETRQEDIPFLADSGGVVVSTNTDMLRALTETTLTMRLVAVDAHGERSLGEYTFHHAPYKQGQ